VKVHKVHERRLDASPERVSALFGEMDRLWPAPAPQPEDGKLRVGLMLWRRDDRCSYRIVDPPEFPARHWFEVDSDGYGGTILRHTVEGEAVGAFEEIWRDRVEPMHDAYIEALFDRAEEALA
jgi:hypothetical protein